MTRTLITLGFLAALALSACSNDSTAKKEADGRVTQAGVIGNSYTSECQNVSFDLLHFSAEKVQYAFDDATNVRRVTTYYNENNCTTPIAKVEEKGTYDNIVGTADDNNNVDLHWQSVNVSTLDDRANPILNAISFCGANDWATNSAKDVTAKTSDSPVVDRCWKKTPANQYDILHNSGNTMTFGLVDSSHDKSAPEKRPDVIDKNLVYSR